MSRKTAGFGENDAFSKWGRLYYCYLSRAGVRSKIKRGARRRERREGNEQIMTARDEAMEYRSTPGHRQAERRDYTGGS